MIKQISVYDFDGTVVDSSHRYRTQIDANGLEKIDLQYWIDNEHKTLEDTLLPLAERFKEELANPEIFVIVATARIWCELSEKMAVREGVKAQHIIARKDRNDQRGGAALKITGLKRLLNLKQFKNVKEIHIFEDNQNYLNDLVDAFNGIGHFYPSNQGH